MAYLSSFMNFFGTIARLGTILYETDDMMLRVQYLISFSLGLIYQIQFFLYWNSDADDKEKTKVEDSKKDK